MRLNLFIDSELKGLTTEFVLDRSVDCGDDLRLCLRLGFSAAAIVVPPGKHTVKIVWAGKGIGRSHCQNFLYLLVDTLRFHTWYAEDRLGYRTQS